MDRIKCARRENVICRRYFHTPAVRGLSLSLSLVAGTVKLFREFLFQMKGRNLPNEVKRCVSPFWIPLLSNESPHHLLRQPVGKKKKKNQDIAPQQILIFSSGAERDGSRRLFLRSDAKGRDRHSTPTKYILYSAKGK